MAYGFNLSNFIISTEKSILLVFSPQNMQIFSLTQKKSFEAPIRLRVNSVGLLEFKIEARFWIAISLPLFHKKSADLFWGNDRKIFVFVAQMRMYLLFLLGDKIIGMKCTLWYRRKMQIIDNNIEHKKRKSARMQLFSRTTL